MTQTLSHTMRRTSCPNDGRKLDIPPASAGEALRADVERMQEECPRVYETVAELAMVTTSAVYKWFERKDHQWKASDVEAVVRVTGGLHYLAWLRRLGAPALRRLSACHYEILEDLTAVTERLAKTTSQTARELSPADDTPGHLDREERRQLVAQLGKIRAAIDTIAAAVGED